MPELLLGVNELLPELDFRGANKRTKSAFHAQVNACALRKVQGALIEVLMNQVRHDSRGAHFLAGIAGDAGSRLAAQTGRQSLRVAQASRLHLPPVPNAPRERPPQRTHIAPAVRAAIPSRTHESEQLTLHMVRNHCQPRALRIQSQSVRANRLTGEHFAVDDPGGLNRHPLVKNRLKRIAWNGSHVDGRLHGGPANGNDSFCARQRKRQDVVNREHSFRPQRSHRLLGVAHQAKTTGEDSWTVHAVSQGNLDTLHPRVPPRHLPDFRRQG